MSSIKIVSTPPGQAPEWVRKEWIGVEIPLPEEFVPEDFAGGIQMGIYGGKAENKYGYEVETSKAMEALYKESPKAAKWWNDNIPLHAIPRLVFSKHVCELFP